MGKLTEGDLYEIGLELKRKHGWVLSWCMGFMGLDFHEPDAEDANRLFLELINKRLEAQTHGQV